MKRAVILIFAMFLFLASPVQALAAGGTLPSGIAYAEIGEKIERFTMENEQTTAGMAVAVFDRSGVIYQNQFSYADRETGLAVDEETVFEWGSVTKLLVWVSVMQLWEQGKIDLNADVREYLPAGFLRNLRFDTPVTMLHLMNHNAGFEESVVGMMTSEESDIMELEAYLTAIQPRQVFEPGTVTAYSNWGVALAGYIAERISGLPFYRYVQDHIFDPLGMTRSALCTDLSDNLWVREQRQNLTCYTSGGERLPEDMYYINMYPAGMCTSTLEDFTIFAMALLNRESPLFADPETYDELMTPTAYFGDTDIPLNYHGFWALESYGVYVIGHGGNTVGCSSRLLLDLESGTGMVVMTNQSNEQVYNSRMPELVFGACRHEPLEFTGVVMSPRTFYHGPLKLYQLLSIYSLTPESSEGMLAVRSDSEGFEKITVPGGGGDYFVITLPELILRYIPVILWAAALVFGLISLTCIGMATLIRRIRRRDRIIPMRKWAAVSCAVQLIPFFGAVPAVLSLLNSQFWARWQYMIVFGSFLAFGVVYALLAVYGIRGMWKRRTFSRLHGAVIASLLVNIFNILYWELGLFWLL